MDWEFGVSRCKLLHLEWISSEILPYSTGSHIQSLGIDGKEYKKKNVAVPVVGQWKQIRLGTMRLQVQSLASLSGLKIRHCRELWCRSKTRLRSGVAVAVEQASSYSSD